MLREKAPAVSHHQKQDQQRKERTAAVSSSAVAHNNNSNNNNNNEDSLTASSAGSTTPHNIFWDLLFVAYLIPIHQSQFGTSWPKKSLAAIKLQYYHHRKFHTQNLVGSTEASVVQKLRYLLQVAHGEKLVRMFQPSEVILIVPLSPTV